MVLLEIKKKITMYTKSQLLCITTKLNRKLNATGCSERMIQNGQQKNSDVSAKML